MKNDEKGVKIACFDCGLYLGIAKGLKLSEKSRFWCSECSRKRIEKGPVVFLKEIFS